MNLVALNGNLVTNGGNPLVTGDGVVALPDGIGCVDAGTLTWRKFTTPSWMPTHFSAVITDASDNVNICEKYMSDWSANTSSDKIIMVQALHYINGVNIIDNDYTDAASFKNAMSGVLLFYKKATT